MFFKTFRSSQTARRIALVAAPLAVIGAAVSTASAADRDGRGWGWGHRSRGPTLAIHAQFPAARVVIGRRVECVDEVPSGLQMSAYQSKDRVIVLISGTNRIEVGSHFTVVYNGQEYELELVAIDRTTFTVRYKGEEFTRPIKQGKTP